ncbi:hypothetical protein BDQ12DRAFT_733408 [Crucibulum laeve]|uniref:Altered inheritance of mitochondria protein 6 n=1 Tax=Crucibulum laeve TaxID=68775 RepID=A0A5C3M9F0_9AGAR|nr:hypothetical protein BDQ12DRAFT_733408 [Crucibulum laeve]
MSASVVIGKPGIDSRISSLEASNSTLLRYPTQFTQGIIPKAIHSHNDYWRDVPLFTALSLGVASVEADVWLVGQDLLVGHELAALTQGRTFDALYIQPLLEIIHGQNPKNGLTVNQTRPNGIFDTSSGTPLQLLVDIKTEGSSTLPFVIKALQPLRTSGYLTTFSNGSLQQSAVTVVGTGNTPLEGIKALSSRDIFFDAPLATLATPLNDTIWDNTIAPIASTDYGAVVGWNGIRNITDTQLSIINQLIEDSHKVGLKARFWDTPGWPINARENVWKQLLDSGADWLNADDLEAASSF